MIEAIIHRQSWEPALKRLNEWMIPLIDITRNNERSANASITTSSNDEQLEALQGTTTGQQNLIKKRAKPNEVNAQNH